MREIRLLPIDEKKVFEPFEGAYLNALIKIHRYIPLENMGDNQRLRPLLDYDERKKLPVLYIRDPQTMEIINYYHFDNIWEDFTKKTMVKGGDSSMPLVRLTGKSRVFISESLLDYMLLETTNCDYIVTQPNSDIDIWGFIDDNQEAIWAQDLIGDDKTLKNFCDWARENPEKWKGMIDDC